MAIILLVLVVCSLVILQRLGIVRRFVFSWDLVGRVFIYVLLLLGVVTIVVKIWSITVVLAHLPSRCPVSPSANPFIDIASTAILGVAIFGIWRWKKWGAYLVLLRLALTIAVQILVYRSLQWHLYRNYTGTENVLADF